MTDALFTQADLNRRLVEAVVKLRVRDCKRRSLIAAEQMERAQQAITGRLLSGFFADGTTDPLSDLSLEMIEGEVELYIAKPSTVIALACLNCSGLFDPEMYIAVNYVDPATRKTCMLQVHIRSLGKSFPFTPVFQPLGQGQSMVSDAGRWVLSTYAKSRGAPEARFAIAAATAQGGPPDVTTPRTLPAGWGLSEGGSLTGR
jgi:hypothetical protein